MHLKLCSLLTDARLSEPVGQTYGTLLVWNVYIESLCLVEIIQRFFRSYYVQLLPTKSENSSGPAAVRFTVHKDKRVAVLNKTKGSFFFVMAAFENGTCFSQSRTCGKSRGYTQVKGNSKEPSVFCLDRTLLSELDDGWFERMLDCNMCFFHCAFAWQQRMINVWSTVFQKLQ